MSASTMPKPDRPLLPTNFQHDDPCLDDYPWFVVRMTTDSWTFGLLLTTGAVAVITSITDIHEHAGIVWVDVELVETRTSATLNTCAYCSCRPAVAPRLFAPMLSLPPSS